MSNEKEISTKVPNLRFPEFSDVWRGVELGDFLINKQRKVQKPNTLYKAVGIRSHFKGTFQKMDSDPKNISMTELFKVQENDFIVNITFAWEGALAIARQTDDGGLVSHRFPTYEFEEKVSSHRFFRYVFPTMRMKYNLGNISPGGAGRNRVLNKKDLLKLKILLPEIQEQQKIAEFLTKADNWLANLKNQKQELENYKKGVMKIVFSNKSNTNNWTTHLIGEIISVSNKKYNPKTDKGNYPDIEMESLEKNTGKLIKTFDSKSLKSIKNFFNEGDVLFGKLRPYLRKYYLSKMSGVCSTEIWVLSSNLLQNNFLYYLVQSGNFNRYTQQSSGSKMPRAEWSYIAQQSIDIPDRSKQQKIAAFLTSIDKLIESKQNQVSEAEKWNKGLLQQMFV
ncbi:MAG: Restriction modification system DNA specificity domain protein [candidate division CPR2 bacterium GW2011_GWC1_39_9]|nr:MAG: Restriction modification system DNA specificity domain protein [candidate division CPR2 bacterium GW2011_GWC1_39_9]